MENQQKEISNLHREMEMLAQRLEAANRQNRQLQKEMGDLKARLAKYE